MIKWEFYPDELEKWKDPMELGDLNDFTERIENLGDYVSPMEVVQILVEIVYEGRKFIGDDMVMYEDEAMDPLSDYNVTEDELGDEDETDKELYDAIKD